MWRFTAGRTLVAEVEAMGNVPLTKLGHSENRPRLVAAPCAVDCLKCQFLGRRRLLCSEADKCSSLPIVFPLGPILLGAWAATAIAFYVAVR
jgi:hypothetical protein